MSRSRGGGGARFARGGAVHPFRSGLSAAITGGEENQANGMFAFVGTGCGNSAGNGPVDADCDTTFGFQSVTGGIFNLASGDRSSITAGYLNTASGGDASVTAGNENRLSRHRCGQCHGEWSSCGSWRVIGPQVSMTSASAALAE
jgi:hypothetical protein